MTDSQIHNPGEKYHPRIYDNLIIHIHEKVSPFLEISLVFFVRQRQTILAFLVLICGNT